MRDQLIRHQAKAMIREGTRADSMLFIELWGEYLEEQYKGGGEMMPTQATKRFYHQLFRAYVDHKNMKGSVFFGPDDQGVSMWGEGGNLIELRWGNTATAWGDYIRPEFRRQGWTRLMREKQVEQLRDKGFDTVLGAVYEGNEGGEKSAIDSGFGPEPVARSYILSLKE